MAKLLGDGDALVHSPCPVKERLSLLAQKRVCDNGIKKILRLMETTFGEGNSQVSGHGAWLDRTTGEVMREANTQIETRFRGVCLTKKAAENFVRELDQTMKGLCQIAHYYEHNNDAVYAFTGRRRT